MFNSHGDFLNYAMYHHRETPHFDETKKMARVRAKESKKGGKGHESIHVQVPHVPQDTT